MVLLRLPVMKRVVKLHRSGCQRARFDSPQRVWGLEIQGGRQIGPVQLNGVTPPPLGDPRGVEIVWLRAPGVRQLGF